jgi:hypothetical protein
MRLLLPLCLLLAACGSMAAAPRPSPTAATASPIPWIAAVAQPTPAPTPALLVRPVEVRDCATSDIVAIAYPGQGAGGWWIRGVVLGNRSDTRCVVAGPLAISYLGASRAVIATGGTSAPTWSSPGWAVLEPRTLPVDDHVNHPGQARIMMTSYGDCEHRELHGIAVTLAALPAVIRVDVEPQPVGGRCDIPGQRLGVSSWPIAPTEPVALPTPAPLPLTFAIDAPAVAFAGEPLRYQLRVRNLSSSPYAWSDCPAYLEWLGGHALTPSAPPPDKGLKADPGAKQYVGATKEAHVLNCGPAGSLAPGGELAFEMLIDVPADAYGLDTLRWDIAGPGIREVARAQIQFLAPRR